MRAATLGDPRVRAALDAMVWAVHNQCPALYCGRDAVTAAEYPAGQQRTTHEGAGGGNIRAFVCASDGEVKAYLAGYWGPERFLELLAEFTREAMPLDGAGLERYHEERARHWALARDALVAPGRVSALYATSAQGGEAGKTARALLDRATALGRLARSHEEAPRWTGRPIGEVLQQIEDEVYTKGAVG